MFSKLKRASAERVVLTAVVVGTVIFPCWVLFVLVWWFIMGGRQPELDLWAMMEALSTAAGLALGIGGGIVALIQLNESIDTRNIAVFNDVFERLMSDEEVEARRWIYLELPSDPAAGLASLTPEGRSKVKLVLNSFDYLGFLLRRGWVSEDAVNGIIVWMAPIVIKVWYRVGPYLDFEVERRRDPDYYSGARYLAERCIEWHRANRNTEYRIIEDAL